MSKVISNREIIDERPSKIAQNPWVPYHFLHEKEIQADGKVRSVNTVFLTNRECPFKCVMCDLWKHTLNESTPEGAIPRQIEYALERLPEADVVKLYNSGNFFDGKAIPKSDYEAIAGLIKGYDHVIVENHPKLTGPAALEFRKLLPGTFEIALGLETIHPGVLPKLNKQITADLFREASRFLTETGIAVRAFILLNPPFLTNREENIEWCLKSIEFAFEAGASACSVIPTRDGNGIMEKLRDEGLYTPPDISAMETVFDQAVALKKGRVFLDLWDLERFSNCSTCFFDRKKRLETMNLTQELLPPVGCECLQAGR